MFNKVFINKAELIKNFYSVKQNNPNCLICAMIKADAYGVGAKQVCKILAPYANFFGVSCLTEAKQIKNLCQNKILIVGPLERGKVYPRFSYTCQSLKDVEYLIGKKVPLNIHLKINTGMNRYGISSLKEFKTALLKIKNSLLNLEGVFTHFATNDEFTQKQYKKFKRFAAVCKKLNLTPILHADNSAVSKTQNHHLGMVRVGYHLYQGVSNANPVVEIETEIVKINNIKKGNLVGYNYNFVAQKNMRVAVVPVGYADGFDFKNVGLKLNIFGVLCRVLNICMDCFMLDVSNAKISVGSKIFLINKENNINKYAQHLKTNKYEILTKFLKIRAKRIIK